MPLKVRSKFQSNRTEIQPPKASSDFECLENVISCFVE